MTRGPSQEAGSNCAPSAQDFGFAQPEEDPHDAECPTDGMLAHKRERLHDVVRPTYIAEAEAVWAAPCNQASQVPQAAHVLKRGIACEAHKCLMRMQWLGKGLSRCA